MNFTYFKFLFLTTIKKRPVWITWLIFLLTCASFIIILPAVATLNTLQIWANTTMPVCESFLGMAAALFTAVLGIHVFKDGMEEGTELIVISKPISRVKIVLTKFFVFSLFCLLVNLTSLVITAFTVFLPSTEVKFYWQLIVSMFIGNLVTFGVFGSIACLLTVKFAKVGVIVTNVIISLVTIIYQCLTLFCFKIPSQSLIDHSIVAGSYILTDRDMTTGKYQEKHMVKFDTKLSNLNVAYDEETGEVAINESANWSTNWKEMKEYWTGEILKDNPTPVLNWTDLAGQISLSYLSVGINDYALRQANRAFAISRFYNYDLTSPASPEIVEGVEQKQNLNMAYTGFGKQEYDLSGNTFTRPVNYTFQGIAPLGTTRLRGYTDKIPVGMYSASSEILSVQDVYFEPEEWEKYTPIFKVIYNNIFDYKLYDEYKPEKLIEYILRPTAWSSTNNNLNRYYKLIWTIFTGRASTDSKLVEYCKDVVNLDTTNLEIQTVDDLNKRFIQFKYYACLKAAEDQRAIINNFNGIGPDEAEALVKASEEWQPIFDSLGMSRKPNSWYFIGTKPTSELLSIPYIQEKTQTPAFALIDKTTDQLALDVVYKGYEESQQHEIMATCTYAKILHTAYIIAKCSIPTENYLFSSLDTPSRSSARSGKTYTVTQSWHSYWETVESALLGLDGSRCVGQNLQYFFYDTTPTTNFYMFAIIWMCISLGLFAAGAIVYNKYDVK